MEEVTWKRVLKGLTVELYERRKMQARAGEMGTRGGQNLRWGSDPKRQVSGGHITSGFNTRAQTLCL